MLELRCFLYRLVWLLKQSLPTADTQPSPEAWLPGTVSAIMLRQPPETTHQLRPLESLTLVPCWGLDDGEWPEPSGRPQRAGTDPCQHLQKAGCVATCLGST